MKRQISHLVKVLLTREEIALAERLCLLIKETKKEKAWALLEQLLPQFWRENDGTLRTLAPKTVYRTLYYLDEPYYYSKSPRLMISYMGNHLEGLLKRLLGHNHAPLGGLVAELSKTEHGHLTTSLFEFNEIYKRAKHPSGDRYLETRLDRSTFSPREAVCCLILMRHLSIQLFELLRERGKPLTEDWKQIDPEWLSWDRSEPISPGRYVIPLSENEDTQAL